MIRCDRRIDLAIRFGPSYTEQPFICPPATLRSSEIVAVCSRLAISVDAPGQTQDNASRRCLHNIMVWANKPVVQVWASVDIMLDANRPKSNRKLYRSIASNRMGTHLSSTHLVCCVLTMASLAGSRKGEILDRLEARRT